MVLPVPSSKPALCSWVQGSTEPQNVTKAHSTGEKRTRGPNHSHVGWGEEDGMRLRRRSAGGGWGARDGVAGGSGPQQLEPISQGHPEET